MNIEFETLHSNKYRIYFLVIFVCVAVLLVIFIVGRSHAKYRVTESIPLVNGTINYTPYDFKTVAMYQKEEGGDYVSIDQVPTGGYTLNTEQSYCEVNDEKDSSIPMSYEGGRVYIGVTSKGTKCYLYFDEKRVTNAQELIASKNVATRTDFSTTLTEDTTGTIYYADTSKGRTYYFAGAPTDNWVRFGGFYWRIIRINEDGTIRMIYQGTSANTTGGNTQIQTSAFNSSHDNNAYVGYMYQSNQVHGLTSSSTIKGILDTWYQNNLQSHADKIDGNAGFCGDRTPSTSSTTSNGSGGTGTMQTYYGAYIRLVNSSKNPTFDCENASDLYTINGSNQGNKALTYPIGLITADEVAYAGGVWNTINQSYYLYTNSIYWTMSPYYYLNANVFYVGSTGNLSSYGNVSGSYGARPVINLKADVTISGGTGQATDPYIVN